MLRDQCQQMFIVLCPFQPETPVTSLLAGCTPARARLSLVDEVTVSERTASAALERFRLRQISAAPRRLEEQPVLLLFVAFGLGRHSRSRVSANRGGTACQRSIRRSGLLSSWVWSAQCCQERLHARPASAAPRDGGCVQQQRLHAVGSMRSKLLENLSRLAPDVEDHLVINSATSSRPSLSPPHPDYQRVYMMGRLGARCRLGSAVLNFASLFIRPL